MSKTTAHAMVDGYSASATVTHERQTFTDPGGVWVEDHEVEDEDGIAVDFEELDERTRERIDEALVDAAASGY